MRGDGASARRWFGNLRTVAQTGRGRPLLLLTVVLRRRRNLTLIGDRQLRRGAVLLRGHRRGVENSSRTVVRRGARRQGRQRLLEHVEPGMLETFGHRQTFTVNKIKIVRLKRTVSNTLANFSRYFRMNPTIPLLLWHILVIFYFAFYYNFGKMYEIYMNIPKYIYLMLIVNILYHQEKIMKERVFSEKKTEFKYKNKI